MIVLPIIMTIILASVLYIFYVNLTGTDPIAVYPDMSNDDADRPYFIPLIMFFFTLLLIILTNYALSKYVTKTIITSITILSDGVREISEGNLTYRIKYNKGDEFDAVCADFNEMASRLSKMVAERQKDEDSRKELIAGISHDLRTPLTSIKAYIEGLKKGVADTPEKREKYLDTIQSKTEDIEYIIAQLFLFSKMDIGEFPLNLEIVDIGKELEKIVAGLHDEYLENGLDVMIKENTEGLFASVDMVQFRNVLQNIIGNSNKYCKNEDACAEISCEKKSDNVVITIKDNGPGVPEAMLEKLFNVFYRSDVSRNNPSKGSGLGLAISAKIIERLNGSIDAENMPGGGLCIIIALPFVKILQA
jgi:signal transduction histidine kinase